MVKKRVCEALRKESKRRVSANAESRHLTQAEISSEKMQRGSRGGEERAYSFDCAKPGLIDIKNTR